ncbi:MAG: GHKL domain-containing protein [Clostridium sp.]|nr:GHKL domain-containing protein [Clostridium sp.]
MTVALILDILSILFCLKSIIHKRALSYFHKENLKILLINFLLSLNTTGILQQLFELTIYILKMEEKGLRDGRFLVSAGCLAVILLFQDKINLNSFSVYLQQKTGKRELFTVFAMLFAGAVIFQMRKFQLSEDIYYLQSVYYICALFFLLCEWQKSGTETEEKEEQAAQSRRYREAYDELRTLVRERQHDMDNHISAILGMIYTIDDHKELVESQRAYCNDLLEKHGEIKLYLLVENRLIAGFLFMKIKEAEKFGIDMTHRIILNEDALIVSEYDLIEMTGILLDNAIEALADTEIAERKIHLEMLAGEEGLRIAVENTCRPVAPEELVSFFQEDYTTKGRGRGVGLKKLKRMVQSMGGEVIVSGEAEAGVGRVRIEAAVGRGENGSGSGKREN